MEANRIRLETANLGEAFVERVAVTDTALTGAGEAGVRFLPGTAHAASVGLHLEGVRVSEHPCVDTMWISSGTGRIAPGQDYLLGGPHIAPSPLARGIICGSANQPPAGTSDFVRDFAEAGFTAVTGDYWTRHEIQDCYGGTLASFEAAEPTANPWNRLEELEGIPIYRW